MPDFATSTDPAVQAQLDRLVLLSPGADILGLDRITRLLARLGDPHRAMPPVLHVAGTNGKGSTCAFLRAAIEAAGLRAHVYSSPHLVRFNERIRLAGRLVDDAALAALLAEVLDAADGIGASFFEITTAAAFLAFARTPADACVVEVGLGGRLDATNVLTPMVAGIAQLGIDHQAFLGDEITQIAREKAGIAKPDVPIVTSSYPPAVAEAVADVAARTGARLIAQGSDWSIQTTDGAVVYRDARGSLRLPRPVLPGMHQAQNLGLAAAMLRHQHAIVVPDTAIVAAAVQAHWPARMQRLSLGPLTNRLPTGSALWLDGGHNEAAAAAVAATLDDIGDDRPLHLIVGMLANKDAAGLLAPIMARHVVTALHAVPVVGHDHHPPEVLASFATRLGVAGRSATDLSAALDAIGTIGRPATVLILGSLYLAGQALPLNDEMPD